MGLVKKQLFNKKHNGYNIPISKMEKTVFMKIKRILPVLAAMMLMLSACTKDKPAGSKEAEGAPTQIIPTATPTPTPEVLSPEDLAAIEKDKEFGEKIQTVMYMVPHGQVDGLFVHEDGECIDYMRSIVGQRIELTAESADTNLFYRYIAYTLGVSSLSELSDQISFSRSDGKIYFTFTHDFDNPERHVVIEMDGDKVVVE